LVDISSFKENEILYLPEEAWEEFTTLNVWIPVSKAIVKGDMILADEEKKKIEQAQRIREALKKSEGNMNEGKYFYLPEKEVNGEKEKEEENSDSDGDTEEALPEGGWVFKDNISIDDEYLTELDIKVEESRKNKQKEKDDLDSKVNTIDESDNESCSVQ